jgi:hypothetical protein
VGMAFGRGPSFGPLRGLPGGMGLGVPLPPSGGRSGQLGRRRGAMGSPTCGLPSSSGPPLLRGDSGPPTSTGRGATGRVSTCKRRLRFAAPLGRRMSAFPMGLRGNKLGYRSGYKSLSRVTSGATRAQTYTYLDVYSRTCNPTQVLITRRLILVVLKTVLAMWLQALLAFRTLSIYSLLSPRRYPTKCGLRPEKVETSWGPSLT